MSEPTNDSNIADREIISTRLLNAPRELVWKAWTEPDRIKNWWGPHGFTNTFFEFDLRPGGTWRFDMHGPDGKSYPNTIVFIEIVKPERIVLDHTTPPKFEITATFEARGTQTFLTFRMLFESAEMCKNVRPIAVPGNEGNFDKLEAHLALMKSA